MKLIKFFLVTVMLISVLNFPLAAGTGSELNFPAKSTWTNAEGSILFIDQIDESSNKITGHYINKAEGYPCQNTPYPLTGWVFGNTITFSVIWQNETESCQALTTWIGFIEGNTIMASWQFVNQSTDDISKVMKGEDDFVMN